MPLACHTKLINNLSLCIKDNTPALQQAANEIWAPLFVEALEKGASDREGSRESGAVQ